MRKIVLQHNLPIADMGLVYSITSFGTLCDGEIAMTVTREGRRAMTRDGRKMLAVLIYSLPVNVTLGP